MRIREADLERHGRAEREASQHEGKPREESLHLIEDGTDVVSVAAIDHPDVDSVSPEVAFHPDGTRVAYLDAEYRTWIVRADGEGEAGPFDGNLYDWVGSTFPQWGAP